MGKTSDSAKSGFGREIGKNTAKVVSNKVFGDSWSTPHRVGISVQREKEKQKTQRVIANSEQEKMQHKLDLIELQQEREDELRNEEKIETVISHNFAGGSKQIADDLGKFTSYAYASFEDIDTQRLKLINACISKIDEGIFKLGLENDINSQSYFSNKLTDIKTKLSDYNKKKKTKSILLSIVFVIALGVSLLFWVWLKDFIHNFLN